VDAFGHHRIVQVVFTGGTIQELAKRKENESGRDQPISGSEAGSPSFVASLFRSVLLS
jgi:hypothetical protein